SAPRAVRAASSYAFFPRFDSIRAAACLSFRSAEPRRFFPFFSEPLAMRASASFAFVCARSSRFSSASFAAPSCPASAWPIVSDRRQSTDGNVAAATQPASVVLVVPELAVVLLVVAVAGSVLLLVVTVVEVDVSVVDVDVVDGSSGGGAGAGGGGIGGGAGGNGSMIGGAGAG